MADAIKLDWAVLEANNTQLKKEMGFIVQRGEDIKAEMTSLLGQVWQGEAAGAYQGAYTTWNRGYQETLEVLNRLTRAMDEAITAHMQNDAGAIQRAQGYSF